MNTKSDFTLDFNKYIPRECEATLWREVRRYPILSVMGPRQCGKTRMIRECFPNLPYFDVGIPEIQEEIKKDITGFIRAHIDGAIFDEFLFVPELTQVLRAIADELILVSKNKGLGPVPTRFILSSSHNYLMMEGIRETMTGRAGLVEMASFTASEIHETNPYTLMFRGGYPSLHTDAQNEDPEEYFTNYIKRYLETEVRGIHKIEELDAFRRFMGLCANRVGNLVDYAKIRNILGFKKATIDHWLNILEIGYITFKAEPFHNNFEKRLTHQSKLYFYDTGLASHLLKITDTDTLKTHEFQGKLFENLVMSDLKKKVLGGKIEKQTPYFWNPGTYEIDAMIPWKNTMKAIEIKASDTFDSKYFNNIKKFHNDKSSVIKSVEQYLIYTGPTTDVEGGRAINFADIDQLLTYHENPGKILIF